MGDVPKHLQDVIPFPKEDNTYTYLAEVPVFINPNIKVNEMIISMDPGNPGIYSVYVHPITEIIMRHGDDIWGAHEEILRYNEMKIDWMVSRAMARIDNMYREKDGK